MTTSWSSYAVWYESMNAYCLPCNISSNKPVAQIPQCTSPKSHNAPFWKRNVHLYAHLCYKMVHCGISVMHCGLCGMVLLIPCKHIMQWRHNFHFETLYLYHAYVCILLYVWKLLSHPYNAHDRAFISMHLFYLEKFVKHHLCQVIYHAMVKMIIFSWKIMQ